MSGFCISCETITDCEAYIRESVKENCLQICVKLEQTLILEETAEIFNHVNHLIPFAANEIDEESSVKKAADAEFTSKIEVTDLEFQENLKTTAELVNLTETVYSDDLMSSGIKFQFKFFHALDKNEMCKCLF